MRPLVFLMQDGTLMSAENDVEVPEWTNLTDAWYLQGVLYDEAMEANLPWEGFVGLTVEGTLRSVGLPERLAQEIASWKDICQVYQVDDVLLAIDQQGSAFAVATNEESVCGNVTGLFGGAAVKKLLICGDLCVVLRKDGTLFMPGAEEGKLVQRFIDGNYAAAMSWTNLADARLLSITVNASEGYALVGITQDNTLLMDGIRDASAEWGEILGAQMGGVDSYSYVPAEYTQRTAYRTGFAISTHYAAMIDANGDLKKLGEVNGSSLRGANRGWCNLVSLEGTYTHIVGLKADGTVVAQGLDSRGQCNVDNWRNITEIAVGDLFTVGLTEYGMIAYTGIGGTGAELAKRWSNVMAIDACEDHVIGLRTDGTALSTAAEKGVGCSEVLSWTHLVDIAAGEEHRAAGILVDGTVVATQNVSFYRVEDFVNLKDVAFSGEVLYGLCSGGTVVASDAAAAEQVASWSDVIQIDGRDGVLIGMRSDGSLLLAGWPDYADEEIPEALAEWNYYDNAENREEPFFFDYNAVYKLMRGDLSLTNASAPAAVGDGFIIAVERDGRLFMTEGAPESLKQVADEQVSAVSAYGRRVLITFRDGSCRLYTDDGVETFDAAAKAVVGGKHLLTILPETEEWKNVLFTAGDNAYGQCEVQGAAAVTEIAAGGQHSIAVINGSHLIATGDNCYGQCEVSSWQGVVQLAAGEWHTLGLTKDGCVLATGNNTYGQCSVSEWPEGMYTIAAGERFSAGVTADGHVLLAGELDDDLRQALAWEHIVFIAANGNALVGVDASGKLYSTGADVSAANKIFIADMTIPDELYETPSLPMMYDTLAVGTYGCIALCEDGTVIYNEIRYNSDYDSDYGGSLYDEYAIGKQLTIADKPVAMVCAVRGGAVLYEDGTVQASDYFPEAAQWTNVIMISGVKDILGALTSDGRIYISGNVSDEVAAQVTDWPLLQCIDVGEKHVIGVTLNGSMISTNPQTQYDSSVWHDITSFGHGIGIRSDGTTTADSPDGRRAIARGYARRNAKNEALTVYADGSISTEIPGVAYPIVQLEVLNDCFILQQQDGSILINGYTDSRLKDVHLWHVALPEGVEKVTHEETLPDGVPGTATFRPYSRLYIDKSTGLLAVLSDGRVLQKNADQWAYDEATRTRYVVESRQALLDETVWYDIVEIVGGLGLRKDGLVVMNDYKGASVLEGWQNVRKLVANGYGAILNDGTYVSRATYNVERDQAASAWSNLVDVQYVGNGIVGLRSDGTVLSYGLTDSLAEMISGWRNITEIVAYTDYGSGHLAGLTADGELFLTDAVPGNQSEAIEQIGHIMGESGMVNSAVYVLYQDGTVGNATYSSIKFYSDNGDIVDFVCDGYCAVGLKSDGWMVYAVTMDPDMWSSTYDDLGINTINIDTLEGVNVQ